MDDVKTQAPDNKEPVSVKSGGAESEPIASSPEVIKQPEKSEIQDSEPTPELDNEVKESGVEVVSDTPKIDNSAKDAGIQDSIPKGPNYKVDSVDEVTAEKVIEKGDTTDANIWRTLVSVLKTKREKFMSLFKTNQTQQKST